MKNKLKMQQENLNISNDIPSLTSVAKEMYEAINYTLNYNNRKNRVKDDYEVTFLYHSNNLSFQKLLKSSE